MPKSKITINEKIICEEYQTTNIGVESLASKYHVGKLKIKDILNRNNIKIKKKGKQELKIKWKVEDWRINKYPIKEGFHYIVYDEKTDFVSIDIENKGGHLTSYIERCYGITTPTLYDRRKYYMTTGNYWWEQWLTVKLVKNNEVKKCPYCNWETIDIHNKSGMFETHLLKKHNKTKFEYLEEHPEDREYFYCVEPTRRLQLETNTDNFVTCKICGKKLKKISNKHLSIHKISKEQYINMFGNSEIMCTETHDKFKEIAHKVNINLSSRAKERFTSKAELEIVDFLKEHEIESVKDRKLLNGKELDIFIPSKNIAIEYNGNMWHTEKFGNKDKHYHLNKLEECNKQGVKLIQICDDEYIEHKEIVMNKISHIIGIDNKQKIYAKKTIIKPIHKYESDKFLDMFHIQGAAKATIYLGCFYEDKLIAVMTFKNGSIKNKGWELNRFASDYNYICVGIGGKLFKYFIRNYNADKIFSFADRRWTVDVENNIYTKLGFVLEKILKPDYKYYLPKGGNNKRIHKMNLSKSNMINKYNMDCRLTESEMANELGYDRIWDCGLIKYIYINPNYKEME